MQVKQIMDQFIFKCLQNMHVKRVETSLTSIGCYKFLFLGCDTLLDEWQAAQAETLLLDAHLAVDLTIRQLYLLGITQ